MKRFLFLTLFTFISSFTFGQTNEGPNEITPLILQKIKADIEKEIPAFKQKMSKEMNTDKIEFSLDTFRIERICAKRMDIDYSTAGINTSVDMLTAAYDQLMNKYYNKLLKLLKPEDKMVLVTAQKAWLVYRDAEAKLIGTMTKEEYSGGGTIQSNIATGSYSSLVVKRAIDVFNYYDDVSKDGLHQSKKLH
jgi:uncharacterized protein YecT (DUF1311 family)